MLQFNDIPDQTETTSDYELIQFMVYMTIAEPVDKKCNLEILLYLSNLG